MGKSAPKSAPKLSLKGVFAHGTIGCAACRHEHGACDVRFAYDGDLGVLMQAMAESIPEQGGEPTNFLIDITKPKSMQDAEQHVQAWRRLVHLCPYPVIAHVHEGAMLYPIDVIVALTCDIVHCEEKKVTIRATSSREKELLWSAQDHWEFYTGEKVDGIGDWSTRGLGLKTSECCWDKLLGDFLPHYWMSLRNCGMASTFSVQGLSVEESFRDVPKVTDMFTVGKNRGFTNVLDGAFNFYFGPKIASLFAATDARNCRFNSIMCTRRAEKAALAEKQLMQNKEKVEEAIANAVVVTKTSEGSVTMKVTSDVLYASLEEVTKLLGALKDPSVRDINILLRDGVFTGTASILPRENRNHMQVYKWHRKWEQLLALVKTKKVRCIVEGKRLCPPLMEVFFAADERVWSAPCDMVYWCEAPFAYSPGPEALQGCLTSLPLATLRRLLLVGMPTQEAAALGMLSLGAGSMLTVPASMPMAEQSVTVAFDPSGKRRVKLCNWIWGGGMLELPERCLGPTCELGSCSMIGYGLAVPEEHKATQEEIARMLGVTPANKRDWSILTSSHIQTRYLAELARDLQNPASVGPERLHEKHLHWATTLLRSAIQKAVADAKVDMKSIGYVSIVNSSAYLLPGLTAYVIQDEELRIPKNACRHDIIGMGCHAGLNSLKSAAAWAVANPGKLALACGVEVLSAAYVWGETTKQQLNTVIVNSLFGDGCFAAVLRASPEGEEQVPDAYLDMPPEWWSQLCDTEALDDMIYNPEMSEGKTRFDLSELAPYHVGQGLFSLMSLALQSSIPVHYADHVVTHTGGKTVLDCSAVALGLEGVPKVSLPYTIAALRDYGNQSSCSIMFAFDNLVTSGDVLEGDLGLFVTMGPGAGLEMALWTAGKRFPARQAAPVLRLSRTMTFENLVLDSVDFQDPTVLDWLDAAENEARMPRARRVHVRDLALPVLGALSLAAVVAFAKHR